MKNLKKQDLLMIFLFQFDKKIVFYNINSIL